MKVAPSTDFLNPTKLFAFVGRFKDSSLHILKNQLETTQITEVPLRAIPLNTWALKRKESLPGAADPQVPLTSTSSSGTPT